MSVQFQPRFAPQPQTAPVAAKKTAAPANESSGRLAARLVLRGVAQTAEFAGGMAGLAAGVAGGWLVFNSLNFKSSQPDTGYADRCGNNLPLTAYFQTEVSYPNGAKPICQLPKVGEWKDNSGLMKYILDQQFLMGVGLAAASIVAPAIGNKIAAIARDWEQQIAGTSPQPVKPTSIPPTEPLSEIRIDK